MSTVIGNKIVHKSRYALKNKEELVLMKYNLPQKNRIAGNYCAYCNYWEGNANLHSSSTTIKVEFNSDEKGRCLKSGASRRAGAGACTRFEISPNASRYAK